MAKVSFSKLGLKAKNDIKIVEFNGQNIEVKQYLPINDTLELISKVINQSADDNNFSNPVKLDIFTVIEVIDYYTNISFTEKQREDPAKLFDLIAENDLYETILEAIPRGEIDFIESAIDECSQAIYTYRNSVMGILDTVSQDYSNLDLDATNIQKKLADPNNMEFLKNVISKLG